ncbi:tRNA (N6-threonylcarbamoyladenosine(37)-N6)-methyltransferase TrmO [Thiohalophilus sp.]|uniref:tRNA (N6-threonylcarbamoyladenosine(37)-N6)-methyltransferase TrmO n=1 Tax=Thiohalophilus sp. TaxID=3028392 RepID=UPI002ACDEB71|nr:tRNA (N6-threonylcarbamoyladenosine(37)-N6)-methyltransferase TrmO [Thiohalophilus sp.]MDZ7804040.1 tRNA (N6-threonylcarbamoyladenosine(37)-N6)-methyltransferase TrmO [Thiohalophilus sp.]
MDYSFSPIGVVHSCFSDKFGVPRQPRLAPAATGQIELLAPYNREEAVRELAGFSHIWVVFVFHEAKREAWKPTVRPPRLGGNRRVGVFASRSPERPNPIGLSLLTLDGVETGEGRVTLQVSNLDLIDGTPVLDIKPYIPYADSVPDARAGFAPQAPDKQLPVNFSATARQQLEKFSATYPNLADLIEQVLQQDPRPAYQDRAPDSERVFGMQLYDLEIKWQLQNGVVQVIAVVTQ